MTHWQEVIGKVSFVNCDPLYHDLPDRWKVLPAPPSWLTGHLLRRDCLVAPIPAADFAAHSDELVLLPGIGIAAPGAVGSVLLFGGRDPSQMRDVALPTDSATSVRLMMWIFEQLGCDPRPVEMGPDLGSMLERCDGALLIGDRALDQAAQHPELVRMDLGQTWNELTGHPMVFGVYAARRDAPADKLEAAHQMLLEQARRFNEEPERRQAVIQASSRRSGFSEERLEQYFGEVVLSLDESAMAGLDHFLTEVCDIEEIQMFAR